MVQIVRQQSEKVQAQVQPVHCLYAVVLVVSRTARMREICAREQIPELICALIMVFEFLFRSDKLKALLQLSRGLCLVDGV